MVDTYFLRKIAHVGLGALTLYLIFVVENAYDHATVLWLAFIALLLFLIIDFLRIELNVRIPIFSDLQKEKEQKRMIAITYATLGILLVLYFYPLEIALAALGMSYFGDPAAAIVGKRWGTKKVWKEKTMQGIVANFVVCIVVGLFFLNSILSILIMALAASFIELFMDHLEDNLYVPVFAGVIGVLLSYII
ncbi:hypothetical protein J4457_03045 [Candidatus Woesearchaeota archaeon]|nr:hypothetical protein [Candidatus Woesearchaeota archaeon]